MATISAKFLNDSCAVCLECDSELKATGLVRNKKHLYNIGLLYECVCGKSKLWTNSVRNEKRLLAFFDGKESRYTNGFCNDKFDGFVFDEVRVLKNGIDVAGRDSADLVGNEHVKVAYWMSDEDQEVIGSQHLQNIYKKFEAQLRELVSAQPQSKLPYGRCPVCSQPGVSREADGFTTCGQGHQWQTVSAAAPHGYVDLLPVRETSSLIREVELNTQWLHDTKARGRQAGKKYRDKLEALVPELKRRLGLEKFAADKFNIEAALAKADTVLRFGDVRASAGNSQNVPPQGVQEAAKRGLEMRRKYGRGGTAVGVARARDLSNGRAVSDETVKRMKAYFDRHQPDQKAKGFNYGEKGYPSAGLVAHLLWGGDAGYSWAKKLVRSMNSEKKVKSSTDVCSCGSQFVYTGCVCEKPVDAAAAIVAALLTAATVLERAALRGGKVQK